MVDLEPEALVQAQRPGRVLSIDPEARLGHARPCQAAQRLRRDGPAESPASPRSTDADVLEPTAGHADRRILLGPDPVLDDAGDLVAVPGHDPQVRGQLLAREGAIEVLVGLLARAPVVAERLDLRVEDRPMVAGGH